MYWDMLAKVPMFKNADDAFRLELMKRLTTISVPARFYICKFGNTGAEMFFIRQGSCEVLPAAEDKVLAKLHEGAFFGEIALLEECKRTATIRTATDSQLCVLSKSDFTSIMMSYPATAYAIHEAAQERRRADAEREKLEQGAAAAAATTSRRSLTLSLRNSTVSVFQTAVSRIMTLSRSSSASTPATTSPNESMPSSELAGSAPISTSQLALPPVLTPRRKSMILVSPMAASLPRRDPRKPVRSVPRNSTASPFANARVVASTEKVHIGSLRRGSMPVVRPLPSPPPDNGGSRSSGGTSGGAVAMAAGEQGLLRSKSQGGQQ
ncbi:cyclic nucleotide-binding-like protein [Blastocladiella britannica]|nr:cyclic nucleotide-binding-like protein [Blastocladiella britannica]